MEHTTTRDLGITLLRVSLGVMFLTHGLLLKGLTFGLAGTAAYFGSLGLPGWTAYLVVLAETFGGLALIVGFGTRWVSAALIPVLLGATWVHLGNGWVFTNTGGGWEYPLYLVVLATAQVLLGSGAYALDRPLATRSPLFA